MAIHLDRSPKEDARSDDETDDDAEEAPFLRNLTTGELDVCFELLFDITYLSSNFFAFLCF